jgi:nitronate monooxygenase
MPGSAPLVTAFSRLFGIQHPVVSAPMGRAAPPELVAAVTNAGGLGGIGLSWDSPQRIAELVTKMRRLTNDGPFLANFVLEWDHHERMEAALSGVRVSSRSFGVIRRPTWTARRQRARWSYKLLGRRKRRVERSRTWR